MSVVLNEIHPPSSVDYCISCHLTRDVDPYLVIVCGSLLKVYKVRSKDSINCGSSALELIDTMELYSKVTVIDKLTITNSHYEGDTIIVCLKEAKMYFINFNRNTMDSIGHVVISHAFYFENEHLKAYSGDMYYDPLLAVDQHFQCVVMSFYENNVCVLPFINENTPSEIESQDNTSIITSPLNSYDIKKFVLRLFENGFNIKLIKDMIFLKGGLNPTIAILHEYIGTNGGRIPVCIDTFQIAILSIDIQNHNAYMLWSFNKLPYDSIKMIPSNKNELILFTVNTLIYLSYQKSPYVLGLNDLSNHTTNLPIKTYSNDIFDVEDTVICRLEKVNLDDTSYKKALFTTSDNRVYLMQPVWDEFNNFSKFKIQPLNINIPASCLTYIEDFKYIFVGSRVGDSFLIDCNMDDDLLPQLPKYLYDYPNGELVNDTVTIVDRIINLGSPTHSYIAHDNDNESCIIFTSKISDGLSMVSIMKKYFGLSNIKRCNENQLFTKLYYINGIGHIFSDSQSTIVGSISNDNNASIEIYETPIFAPYSTMYMSIYVCDTIVQVCCNNIRVIRKDELGDWFKDFPQTQSNEIIHFHQHSSIITYLTVSDEIYVGIAVCADSKFEDLIFYPFNVTQDDSQIFKVYIIPFGGVIAAASQNFDNNGNSDDRFYLMVVYVNGKFEIYDVDKKTISIHNKWIYCSLLYAPDCFVPMNCSNLNDDDGDIRTLNEFAIENVVQLDNVIIDIDINKNTINLYFLLDGNRFLTYKLWTIDNFIVFRKFKNNITVYPCLNPKNGLLVRDNIIVINGNAITQYDKQGFMNTIYLKDRTLRIIDLIRDTNGILILAESVTSSDDILIVGRINSTFNTDYYHPYSRYFFNFTISHQFYSLNHNVHFIAYKTKPDSRIIGYDVDIEDNFGLIGERIMDFNCLFHVGYFDRSFQLRTLHQCDHNGIITCMKQLKLMIKSRLMDCLVVAICYSNNNKIDSESMNPYGGKIVIYEMCDNNDNIVSINEIYSLTFLEGIANIHSNMDGCLLVANGGKILVYNYNSAMEKFVVKSKVERVIYATEIKSINNITLVADIHNGPKLLHYQSKHEYLSVVSQDNYHSLEIYNVDFLINNRLMEFVAIDKYGNIINYTYSPELLRSNNGFRLIIKSGLCLHKSSSAIFRVSNCVDNSNIHATIIVNDDGSLFSMTIVEERLVRRLMMYQQKIVNYLHNYGTLNYSNQTLLQYINEKDPYGYKPIVDGRILYLFSHMNTIKQLKIAQNLKTTIKSIQDDILQSLKLCVTNI